jgi:hypothetical protein
VANSSVLNCSLNQRRDALGGLLRRDDGNYLELNQVAPVLSLLRQQSRVVALNDLKATREVRLDPASKILQPFRQHATALAHTPVDGDGVAVLKTFDDHEEHASSHSHDG